MLRLGTAFTFVAVVLALAIAPEDVERQILAGVLAGGFLLLLYVLPIRGLARRMEMYRRNMDIAWRGLDIANRRLQEMGSEPVQTPERYSSPAELE